MFERAAIFSALLVLACFGLFGIKSCQYLDRQEQVKTVQE